MSAHPEASEQRVTPLELFFDLVFVFSITRVTALMAHDLVVDVASARACWCWRRCGGGGPPTRG